jgi:phage-related minor tail protein
MSWKELFKTSFQKNLFITRASTMKLHGPQDDRDKHWKGGKFENSRADLTRKETEAYEGELTRLRNENKTLHDQLNRSLKELRSYQVKYPSPYIPSPQEDEDGNLWTIAPEAVNPLMEAYDTSK